VTAQRPGVELGTRVGVNVILPQDGSIIQFGVPGGGPGPLGFLLGGGSSVHVAFFPTPQLMLEPQLNLNVFAISNGDTETITNFTFAGQVAYLFQGATVNSGYIGGNVAATVIDATGADSQNDLAFGAAVGYRALPKPHVAVRVEAGYRRWLDLDFNEITAALIFGVVL
jgi:hypothetical protein